jgi:hypothetical protein
MKKKVGRKPIVTKYMEKQYKKYIADNNIDIEGMSSYEFRVLTHHFYKTKYGISIICKKDVVSTLRRSVRIANMKKEK